MGERERIGLPEVRALPPGQIVWDAAVPGFGARRRTGDAVAYVPLYRTAEGRQRWYTIGRHGAAASRGGVAAPLFPASRGEGLVLGFKKSAHRIVALAGLPADATPHVLRHSFASLAADPGHSDPTIGALTGHKGQGMTARCVHAAGAVLLAAAEAGARRTAELMDAAAPTADLVPFRSAG